MAATLPLTRKIDAMTVAGGYPANIDNPDDWAAFLSRYLDNRATNSVHNGIGLVALHIVDAIGAARLSSAPSEERKINMSNEDQLTETTEEEPMMTIRLSEWLRMDGEIKQLRAALVEVLTARRAARRATEEIGR